MPFTGPMHRANMAVLLFALTAATPAISAQNPIPRRANAPESPRDTTYITSAPGPHYQAGGLKRALLGSGWRDLWVAPVRTPVLDLATYAGGLTLKQRGGGSQSVVLHLKEEDGWQEYRFRSVDKRTLQDAPTELWGTWAGRIVQDQASILFPAAPVLVHPLLRSVGVLHVPARMYTMGDTPRLGDQRDSVAGMLGTMELKGSEAPDDKPGFAGSTSIKGTEKFIQTLESGQDNRLDQRDLLAARLIDFLINDPDRTPDNFDWARFGEKGAYTWRVLPRDRDQAFMNAGGLFATAVRPLFPKLVKFSPRYNLRGLMYSAHEIDHRLLQELTAADFRTVAARVQRAVTDSVIAQMMEQMPAEWRTHTTADERITEVVRARRDGLLEVADAYYRALSGEVDVHGTDVADRFDVLRHDDGRVTVTITGVTAVRDTFYTRTFLPSETNAVRLYARTGDDVMVIRGAASDDITVRAIAGEGKDVLADSAGAGRTFFYDEDEHVTLTPGQIRVDTRHWEPLKPQTGLRLGSDWRPDWGGSRGWRPAVDYNTSSGLVLGVGPQWKNYGFHRLPYHWSAGARLMVSTVNGRAGVIGHADYNFENSPRGLRLDVAATQLEATRFSGYGNTSPSFVRDLTLVEQEMLVIEPKALVRVGWRSREASGNVIRGKDREWRAGARPLVGEISAGPVLGWVDPAPVAGSPLAATGVLGSQSFGLAGLRLGVELDQTNDDAVPTAGWTVDAKVAGYGGGMPGLDGSFGAARAKGAVYVPLTRGFGPHLALRAGGSLATGNYPAQFAATIGGKSTVRGHSYLRYAGDAAAHGSVELRIPVGTVNVGVRSKLGVFALSDAGRVWFNGASDGGWHSGVGGGLWLSTMGQSVSLAYAKGDGGRFYVSHGLSY